MVVFSFKYLGRALSALYYDYTLVVSNIRKARNKWALLLGVLGRESLDGLIFGRCYLEMVQ